MEYQFFFRKIDQVIKNWKSIISILAIFSLFLVYNRALVSNLTTALVDWLDYPLIVYVIQQHIVHFTNLDIANWANISSYYPSPGGMFFTEVLFVQGVLGFVLFQFTKNYILITNLIFLITALANIASLHFFWNKIFKSNFIVFVLSFLFLFSPYYFSQYVHYQMIAYAFFFFSAGLIIDSLRTRSYFVAGLLSGLQFISGVYLGIFSLTFTGLVLIWQTWRERSITNLINRCLAYGFSFIIIAGFFVYKYSQVKNQYQIIRVPGEYVDMALQPTDIFFNIYPSFWSKYVYGSINLMNKHRRGELFSIGWSLLALSLAGGVVIYKQMKKKNKVKYLVPIVLILTWGIMAGLGPRLSNNGQFLGIKLPYLLLLKFTPFFSAVRGTGRWFFFIQIAIFFFIGEAIVHLRRRLKPMVFFTVIAILLLIYLLEMLPLEQRTAIEQYQSPANQVLNNNCMKGEVILEFPFNPMKPETDIGIVLNYWVKMLLNSMHNDCYLVNGYAGYDPQHFLDFRLRVELAVKHGTGDDIVSALDLKGIDYLKINKEHLFEIPDTLSQVVHSNEFVVLYEDEQYLVAKKQP